MTLLLRSWRAVLWKYLWKQGRISENNFSVISKCCLLSRWWNCWGMLCWHLGVEAAAGHKILQKQMLYNNGCNSPYFLYFENTDRFLHLSIIDSWSQIPAKKKWQHVIKNSCHLPLPLKNTGDWDCNEFHATMYLLLCKTEKMLLLESTDAQS